MRSFARPGSRGPSGFRRRRGTGMLSWAFPVFAVAGVIFLIYAWRVTRDTHALTDFVPLDRRAEIFAPNLFAQGNTIAAFRGWRTLPEDHPWRQASAALNRDWDYPDWYLRNLVGPRTYISSSDATSLSNPVFVTRMTAVGTLLERLRGWLPSTRIDRAGGLNLRLLPEDNLYYAVRGRILVLSPSRRALVRALTLAPEERADARAVERAFTTLGAADLAGRFRLGPEDQLGGWLDTVSFALHMGPDETLVRYTAELRSNTESPLHQLVSRAQPVALPASFRGPASIVMDFGAPLDTLWPAFGELFDSPDMTAERWQQWRSGNEGPLGPPITALAAKAGPTVRLAWRGVSLADVVPAPQIELTASAKEGVFADWAAQLPAPPDPSNTAYRTPMPYFDVEANTAILPWRGGPDLTPAVSVSDAGLLAVSSQALLPEALDAKAESIGTFKGNFHARVQPVRLLDDIAQLGAAWVEAGMLDVEDAEAFERSMATWRERTADVSEVVATAACDLGIVQGEIRIDHPNGATK